MNGIDVIIPLAEGVKPLDECLAALRREVGDSVHTVSATFAWQARQIALEDSRADVIAFVDPNVVVRDHWLASLRLAWETSPHSIAAVGGPIRSSKATPDWAAARLGLVDLGGDLLELDPLRQTLFGGNLSFWRRALVGVGGFHPPLDRRDATDWLSEEHEAQRQLGHWGWLVRYAPGVGAERIVTARRPLSRAWRHGLRTGIAGGRDTGTALRQGARSGVGAAAALATLRRDAAGERAARAAENLGVLIGRRRAVRPGRTAAHPASPAGAPQALRELEPAPTTAAPARPALAVDVVVLYHRFAAGEPDPLGLCVSPDNFEAQLRVLADEFEVAPLADIAATVRAGDSGTGRVAITIDDGYLDNLTTGIPLIAAAGLPATLFAATGHIETGRRFFWDEMQRLLTGPGRRPKHLAVAGRSWPTATGDQREVARKELHELIQPRSLTEIEQVLAELRDWAGDSGEPPEATRPVTIDELKQLAGTAQLDIGAHTRDHVNLAHRSADELREQVERSRDDVSSWLGTQPVAFSYPFGIPRHDVNEDAQRAVAAAGFRYAVVNQPIAVEAGDDPYAMPRLFAPNVGADEFRAWLRRALF